MIAALRTALQSRYLYSVGPEGARRSPQAAVAVRVGKPWCILHLPLVESRPEYESPGPYSECPLQWTRTYRLSEAATASNLGAVQLCRGQKCLACSSRTRRISCFGNPPSRALILRRLVFRDRRVRPSTSSTGSA